MNLVNMRSLIAGKLGNLLMKPPYTREVIDAVLNEAYYAVASKTYCIYSVFSRNLIKDQMFYNLKSVGGVNKDKAEKIICVLWKDSTGNFYKLNSDRGSQYELDRDCSGWRTAASSIPAYVARDQHWLTIYPAYTASVTDGLWIFCVRRPDVLSGTAEPDIPNEYFNYLIQWTMNVLTNKDSENFVLGKLMEKERATTILRIARNFDLLSNKISSFTH